MSRCCAEIIPAVTVPPKPKGLPMATTQSPDRSLSESPNLTALNFLSVLIFRSARSSFLSVPISSALMVEPPLRMTVISPASATTLLLVTTIPCASTINPDPTELTGRVDAPLLWLFRPRWPRCSKKSRNRSSLLMDGGRSWASLRDSTPGDVRYVLRPQRLQRNCNVREDECGGRDSG